MVTSDGTASGSALVWLVWAPDGEGNGAQLRAYDAVPADGVPVLRFSAPVGASTKFSSPGVGGNRVYVGTRDGHVLGFGSPVDPTLTGPATSFGNTRTGESTQRTVTLRAERDLTITSISTSSPRFAAASPALGTSLQAGDEVSVPVTFSPAASGPAGASLLVETSAGPASFSLAGVGLSPEAELHASPPIVSFGGATVGRGRLTGTVTLSNFGAQPLTIDSLELPAHPFSVDGAPAPGATIPPGASIDLSVSFEPTSPGQFTDAIGLETSAGEESVGLSGSASPPGRLQVSPAGLDLGGVPLGQARAASLELSNTGGSQLTIMKSKPPAFGPFTTLWGLPEGSTIPPGAKLTLAVSFRPTALGRATDRWVVTADDDVGQRDISLAGEGVAPWAATPVAPAAAPPGPLRFLSLRLSHSRLRTARSRARLPRSALVRYWLSAGATISLRVRRAVRRRERTVWVAVRGSLIRRSATGAGSLGLHPRIGGHALPSGHYRLVASATGSGRTSGAPSVTRSFSVVG